MVESPEPRAQLHIPFPAERYLGYLSTTDVAALQKEKAAVILQIGSFEQHGPHLPLITDSLSGQTLLGMALARLDPAVQAWVVPPLAYGKSNEHDDFAGTISLSAATLSGLVFDVARSVARAGFRRLVLLNSHGGNPDVLNYTARDVRAETGLMVFSIATFRLGLELPPASDEERTWGTHANEWETSMLLALAPEVVHMDRTAALGGEYPRDRTPTRHLRFLGPMAYAWLTSDASSTGVLGDPRAATADSGGRTIDETVTRLAELIEEICTFEMPIPAGSGTASSDHDGQRAETVRATERDTVEAGEG